MHATPTGRRHEADPDPHGGLRPRHHGLLQIADIHWRPAGKAVRRPRRYQIRLERHGFRLSRRGHPVAGRERRADAWLSVVELLDRSRFGTELRRPAVSVLAA